jgi:hypothetical protein
MLREDAEALKQDVEPLDRVLGAARHSANWSEADSNAAAR